MCAVCAHAVAVPAKEPTIYLRCAHPSMPKYPLMPVVRCAYLTPRGRRDPDGGDAR